MRRWVDTPPMNRSIRRCGMPSKHKPAAAFLKLEPGLFINSPQPDFAGMGFHASPQTVQPPNTICLDIRGSDSDIMARMNQGTRRKIRKSLKSGIAYNEGTRRDLPDFNRLMRQTSERNAFAVHSAAYYEAVYDRFIPEYGALLTAKHAGRPLAAIMVFALRGRRLVHLWRILAGKKQSVRDLWHPMAGDTMGESARLRLV